MSAKRNCRLGVSMRGQAVLAAAVVAWGAAAHGQTTPEVIWDGGSVVDDKYVTPENWNPDSTPTNAANQFLQINDGSTALIQASDAAEGAFLMLGMRPGDSGHLNITGGTARFGEMRVGGRETINNNLADWTLGTFDTNGGGTGTVTQSGGDVLIRNNDDITTEPPINSLYIGDASLADNNTANGTYTITGGTLTSGLTNDDAIVIGTGPDTQGAFNQSGSSTVTSTGFVSVGRAGATASYTLNGGTLNVGTGTASTSMNLRIGDGEYPTGIITAGTTGTFTHTNGSVVVKNEISVGRNTGTASYTITGADSSITSSAMNVGASGTGTYTMGTTGGANSDESITLLQSMSVGIGAAANPLGTGTFTIKSGTLAVGTSGSGTRVIAVGNDANGKGTFNQEGGAVSSTDLFQIGRNNSNQDNVYNMSGGTATANRWFVAGGSGAGATSGKGTLNLSGTGAITCGENFNIGAGAGGGTTANGTVNMTGGSITLTAGALVNTGIMAIGNGLGATGTFTHSGGTVTVNGGSFATVDVGRNNASGTYTLSGTGNLVAQQLRMNDLSSGTGTKSITFNGGTSTITQLTLGNVGVMTVNGGTHTISNVAFSTGSSFTTNINLSIPAATHGTSAINVGPGATLTLGSSTTAAAPRTITKGGAGTYTVNGAQSHFAGTTLLNTAGTVNLDSDAGNGLGVTTNGGAVTNFNASQNLREVNVNGGTVNLGANNVNTTGAVSLASGAITGTGTITTGTTFEMQSGSASPILAGAGKALNKTTAGTVTLTGDNSYTGGTSVQAGTLQVTRMHSSNAVSIDAGATLRVLESSPGLGSGHPAGNDAFVSQPSSLTIAAGATLDVTNNDVILDYSGASPIATYEALVASAYNVGVGDWSGTGITSSIAQADGNYVVAIADNAALAAPFGTANGGPLFAGVDVDIDTILIKFTHRADVDLDGVITPNDAAIFGGNYSENDPAVWSTGDMDYDGIYTPNDAAIFGGFYDESLASLPEPGTLGVLTLAGLGLARRRRRSA